MELTEEGKLFFLIALYLGQFTFCYFNVKKQEKKEQ
jgi:hypothetical protein